MSSQRGRFFARHSWKMLLGLVLVIGLLGVGDVIRVSVLAPA